MVVFEFRGRVQTGVDPLDTGIDDLLVLQGPGGPVLISASGGDGGIVSYNLSENALPGMVDQHVFLGGAITGTGPTLTGLQTGSGIKVLVGGASPGNPVALGLNIDGSFGPPDQLTGALPGSGVQPHLVQTGSGALIAASPLGDGFTAYSLNGAGNLTGGQVVTDKRLTHIANVSALATATVNGVGIVVAASGSEQGLTAFVMSAGTAKSKGSIGPEDGLGLMVPTDMAVVALNGVTYVIVGSAPNGAGSSGALSVMTLTSKGELTPVDHVLDTLTTRFGQVQALEAVVIGERAYIVAGGGDGGLSLFELAPGGQLIHRGHFEGTVAAPLDGITDIALAHVGDELQIFVSSETGRGVVVLSIDLSDQGQQLLAQASGDTLNGAGLDDLLVGQAGDDRILGGSGDDVIIDGAGADVLSGGNGADVFVLARDGATDRITDFNVVQDRIDLSNWPFLYDPQALTIVETANGARITRGDEVLVLVSDNGKTIKADALRAAILLEINRSFSPPQVVLGGTAGDDLLAGSWGLDTLSGGAGNDTLTGDAGDDLIEGGTGTDTGVMRVAQGEVTVIDLIGDRVTVQSSQGLDVFDAVELFEFTDATLSFNQLADNFNSDPDLTLEGTEADDSLTGAGGDDQIFGRGGNDILIGEDGSDILLGDDGNDTIYGGLGEDRIEGGNGVDEIFGLGGRDTIMGGAGNDTIRGGRGEDLIYGGDGKNKLLGQRQGDELHGGDLRDILNGGGGNDVLFGYDGNDRLKGGSRRDLLVAGPGPDKLFGNRHDDTLKGGSGNDLLNGGGDNDILTGGRGDDWLKGGEGADVFLFAKGDDNDRIVDFEVGVDTLKIEDVLWGNITDAQKFIDSFARVSGGNVAFDFGNGDTITLAGLTTTDGLAGSIVELI